MWYDKKKTVVEVALWRWQCCVKTTVMVCNMAGTVIVGGDGRN